MKKSTLLLPILLVGLWSTGGSAFAQGGGSHPAPSLSGGSAGGPGMSGAAINAGGGSANRSASFSGGSFQSSRGGQGQTGERPMLGGEQGGAAPRPTPSIGQGGSRPTLGGQTQTEGGTGGGFLAQLQSGGGFAPFSGDTGDGGETSGVERRFGGRGGGSFSLDSYLNESGFTGFAGLSDQTFQDALAGASDSAGQAADQAVQQAQTTYDQFWSDYYAAVDSTAQTYYDTVTSSADYLLQSYEQAVDYTTQAVDSYTSDYDQYLAYCAQYPWDCYSYAYDAATGSYSYTGDVSNAPVTTVTIGDVTLNGAYPPAGGPTPSPEAYEALVAFANDQLGATVDPLYAGTYTGDMAALLAYLPAEMQAYVQNLLAVAGAAYWGLWQGGGGAVMVGDCSTNPSACAISTDTLSAQLTSASAGVYSLLTREGMPASPDAALQLVTRVYPKLTGLSFAQVTDVESGYAFTATTASLGIDPVTHQPISAAKVIYAGVVNVNGQALVYALVGIGEGYVRVLS